MGVLWDSARSMAIPCALSQSTMAPLKSLTREFTPGVSWTLQCEREREVDGVHVYSLFYAKMLALLTPRKLIPQLLLDGRLWLWWSRISEGVLTMFEGVLMFFLASGHLWMSTMTSVFRVNENASHGILQVLQNANPRIASQI